MPLQPSQSPAAHVVRGHHVVVVVSCGGGGGGGGGRCAGGDDHRALTERSKKRDRLQMANITS